MHRLNPTPLPDRLELEPPPSADHSTWIVDQRPRRTPRPAPDVPARVPRPVAVHDAYWVTRLL
jgi:hypothetical protein